MQKQNFLIIKVCEHSHMKGKVQKPRKIATPFRGNNQNKCFGN